jgi:hypothetical protein
MFPREMHKQLMRKKNKKGCLGGHSSRERLGEERFFFFLHQKLIFFFAFFHGPLSLFRGLATHVGFRRATHAKPENEERKKKKERNSFFLTL